MRNETKDFSYLRQLQASAALLSGKDVYYKC